MLLFTVLGNASMLCGHLKLSASFIFPKALQYKVEPGLKAESPSCLLSKEIAFLYGQITMSVAANVHSDRVMILS